MLKKLFTQLLTLASVSILIGLSLQALGISILVGIGLGIALQFGLYYAFSTALKAYVLLSDKKIENERIKEFSFQSVEVTCPCFKKVKDIVPVRLNTDNKYKCNECGKSVGVYLTAETAIVTEPILDTNLETINKTLTNSLKNANS